MSTPAASIGRFGAYRHTMAEMMAMVAARRMAKVSPNFATTNPLGRSPITTPIMSRPEMMPAVAIFAPSALAVSGTTGIRAPSPVAKRIAGR